MANGEWLMENGECRMENALTAGTRHTGIRHSPLAISH